MNRQLKVLALVALLGVAVVLARLPAQDKKDEALAADLDKVPSNAVFFFSMRFAEQWQSDAFKPLREKLAKDAHGLTNEFEKALGVPPEEVERLTLVMQDPGPSKGPLMLVGTTKAYDKDKLLARIGKTTQQKIADQRLYINEREAAFWFFADRAFAVGPASEVRTLLETDAKKDGPLTSALKTAAGKHQNVLALNCTVVVKGLEGSIIQVTDNFKPLMKATLLTATADVTNEGLKVDSRLSFSGAADAKAAEKPAQEAMFRVRMALPGAIEFLDKQPDAPRVIVELAKKAEAALKDAKLTLNGSDLELAGEIKMEPKALNLAIVDTVQQVRDAAQRMQSTNNLKQLGIAMYNYASANNDTFPPAAVFDKNGKSMLSWRVLLLPYLDQDALYKEFHLDEPWDSEHNKKLLAKMPKVYAAPGAAAGTTDTPYQAIVGKDTIFPGRKGLKFPAGIPDGTSNTIMFVEAAKAVPWTKPDDIEFDNNKLLPRLGGLFPGGFNMALCDGSVRFVRNTIKEEVLRLLVMPNDGQPIPDDF